MANPIKIIKAVVRGVGGISGKGSKNVNPVYKESGGHVKVIKPGTKDLTFPTKPMGGSMRSQSDIARMRGNHPGY
jgi:hypothetical protein